MEIKPLRPPVSQAAEDSRFTEWLKKEEDDLIGTEDVAKLLGIKVDRVRYLCRQNRLPSRILSNHGQRIFSKKEILSLEMPV